MPRSDWEKMINIAECVYDITTVLCSIIHRNPKFNDIGIDDSREMFYRIYDWAKEFERENPDPVDYMLEIEMFAYRKLKEIGYEPLGGEINVDSV